MPQAELLEETRGCSFPAMKAALTAARSGRLPVLCRARLPVPGQQLVELASWMLGDPGQDIGEPSLRIDAIHFGGDDEAVHGCGALASAVGSAE